MNFFKKFFGKKGKPSKKDFTEEEFAKDYELKTAGLEAVLGKMHHLVGHAIVSFEVGGVVDMYYFPNHIQGTGFATMELLDPAGNGPLKNRFGTYELLAFTKHDFNDDIGQTPFRIMERTACGFLTDIGNYSFQAELNPKDTIELPNEDGEENTFFILDLYEPDERQFKIGDRLHHLLLCLQVFKSEMNFARQNGTNELLKLLKAQGHYPYSDLDREPVA